MKWVKSKHTILSFSSPACIPYLQSFKARHTGYNQSVTGCGSQRKHVVVTQRKLI